MDYITRKGLLSSTWQSFERVISRLLQADGFSNVRLVGGSGDHGADLIANKYKKRWLFQAKHWKKPVGIDVVKETVFAISDYKADIGVIVSARGFEAQVYEYQTALLSQGINIQLWDADNLVQRFLKLPKDVVSNKKQPRKYQETAIQSIVQAYLSYDENKALIVLATGLGKTFVAAEAMRRIHLLGENKRILVLAHTNPLVAQLEQSFWPFLKSSQSTLIWNGNEHPTAEQLRSADMVFACVDTVFEACKRGEVYDFDIVIVDECHHAGSSTYRRVLEQYNAGEKDGSFLLGLTATPWRPDESDIRDIFGDPRISIDMVYGMKNGFLANVDYRMHTDNIDWDSLKNLEGKSFSPKQINKTLFINQWDDAVVEELQRVWHQQPNPRAIVFCGTISHATTMRDKINALGFCNAAAIFSSAKDSTEKMSLFERNRVLSDFSDGRINVICTVDVFNEGIDVPDVNILVFQRVTHSRRIFIQQLGRGLRIADDKEKVIVLDFVSDIRRFAAGLDLKGKLYTHEGARIDLPNKVTFTRVDGEDPKAESFLKEWLEDVATIEDASDDASILKFPPRI
jgi:superfamily II DNA or RNA helicase